MLTPFLAQQPLCSSVLPWIMPTILVALFILVIWALIAIPRMAKRVQTQQDRALEHLDRSLAHMEQNKAYMQRMELHAERVEQSCQKMIELLDQVRPGGNP